MAKRFGKPRASSKSSSPSTVAIDRRGKKTKIALRIPSQLAEDVSLAIARDQYSPKKKSVWVEEALQAMARHDADMSESLVGDRAQGPNKKQMVVALSTEGCDQLKDSIVRLRLQLPTIEGVQSLVLRCAMRFRIRHPEFFVSVE
jgi:hypothetical protein